MNRLAVPLLTATLCLLFADHSLLGPNLTAIADEFGFDAAARDLRLGGFLSFLVTGCAALSALVCGSLADRLPRVSLFCGAVLVAEIGCLAITFAETWPQLVVLRALTGLGLGGAVPVAFALGADLVPRPRRSFTVGVLWTALGAGIIVGVMVAGQLGPPFGWRLPFAVVAVPNLVLVVLFAKLVAEPARRTPGLTPSPPGSGRSRFRRVLAVPTNRWLYLEEVFEILPFAVISAFLPDYLAQNRGFTVQQGGWAAAAFGLAAIVSKLGGGWLGDRLLRRNPRALAWLGAMAMTAAVPLIFTLLWLPGPGLGGRLGPTLMLSAAVGLLAPLPKPLTTTLVLEVNPPAVHGTALAGQRFAAYVGQAAGPLAAGGLMLLCGRMQALFLIFCSWLVAAALLLPVATTLTPQESPPR